MGAERFAENVKTGARRADASEKLGQDLFQAPPPVGEKPAAVQPQEVARAAEATPPAADVSQPSVEFKNPELFGALVKSTFSRIDADRDGNLSLPELKAFGARIDGSTNERGMANLIASKYGVFAGLAHDDKKFTTRDLDRFLEVTPDNVCNTAGRAAGNAIGWAILVGVISAAAGSEQSGLNAAASGTSAAVASTIESSILQKGRDSLRSINYFNLKGCG